MLLTLYVFEYVYSIVTTVGGAIIIVNISVALLEDGNINSC